MIQSQQMQHRRVDVIDLCRIVSIQWFVAEFVTFAVRDAAFDAAAAQPIREAKWIVIASGSGLA